MSYGLYGIGFTVKSAENRVIIPLYTTKFWRRGKQDKQDRKRQDGQDTKFILPTCSLSCNFCRVQNDYSPQIKKISTNGATSKTCQNHNLVAHLLEKCQTGHLYEFRGDT
jgi:hypothetical protein